MGNESQSQKKGWINALNWVVLVFMLSAIVYVYAGFYWPDPSAHRITEAHYAGKMLWLFRIGIPVLIVGALALWIGLSRSKVTRAQAALVVSTFALCAVVAIHVFAYRYYRYQDQSRSNPEFHPYLQLAPGRFQTRASAEKSVFKIMCLGGSTTAILDSGGNRGWPERVEELLRTHFPELGIQVYNVGNPWYTTLHNLINYQTNLRHHRPEMIIFMEAINDLLQNADFSYFSRGPFREDYGHFVGPLSRVMGSVSFERTLWGSIRAIWYAKPRQVIEQRIFPGLIPYERNLNALIDLAEKDHVKVVLMTQPTLIKSDLGPQEREALYMVNNEAIGPGKKWSTATALSGMQQYNNRVRELAATRKVPLIDLEKQIPKKLEYFLDDVHYKDQTFDMVANYVAQELLGKYRKLFSREAAGR